MRMELGPEMSAEIVEGNGEKELRLQGELCLPALDDLRRFLLEAVNTGIFVSLRLDQITASDLGGYQLLCSAHRTFKRRGLRFSANGSTAEVRRAALAAGFHPECSTCRARDASCLWSV